MRAASKRRSRLCSPSAAHWRSACVRVRAWVCARAAYAWRWMNCRMACLHMHACKHGDSSRERGRKGGTGMRKRTQLLARQRGKQGGIRAGRLRHGLQQRGARESKRHLGVLCGRTGRPCVVVRYPRVQRPAGWLGRRTDTQERGSSGEHRGGSNAIIERRNKRRSSGRRHGAPRPEHLVRCGVRPDQDIGPAEPAPQKQVAPLAGRQLRPLLPRRQAPCCCHLLLAGDSLTQTCPSRHTLQLDGTPPPREARLP